MIKIICLGKLKEKYLIDLVNDYLKLVGKDFDKFEIELKDEENLEKEALNIKKYIGNNEFIIALDINGKSFTSEEFASLIDQTFINYSTITFIIGSSTGLDKSIKNISNLRLSFSSFTFPHGLFRGILLEQIYRAFKINNHETYHK